MQKDKSFTLIELLVVIAIIGLLSSIVLVSLKGVRERAKIAKTLEFSQSIQNALGSEAVGIWSFDEGSGSTAKDSSGYGNNGTISGASYTSDTPHQIVGTGAGKYALSFNGVGNYYVQIPDPANESLDFGSAQSFTVEMWIKPNSCSGAGCYQQPISKLQYETRGWYLKRASEAYWEGFYLFGYNGEMVPSQAWTRCSFNVDLGKWSHLAWVVDREKGSTVYKDGKSVSTCGGLNGYSVSNNETLLFGKGHGGYDGQRFNGLIDEIKIYGQVLPAAQIQKHYAKGLAKHQLAEP